MLQLKVIIIVLVVAISVSIAENAKLKDDGTFCLQFIVQILEKNNNATSTDEQSDDATKEDFTLVSIDDLKQKFLEKKKELENTEYHEARECIKKCME